ncbi:MAG TPA: DUF222 domain-containing protein [Ilumatobacter sp.]|nr:DUF222 domain-containing protein [Ilumatobacter sp.]
MSVTAVDNSTSSTSLLDALAVLIDHEPNGVDRERLGELMSLARKVRGFLDGFDIACARRGRELNEQGQSESAFGLFLNHGCGSGKEAYATEIREGVCADLPEFEEALTAGSVSNQHLDALGRHTKNLTDEERGDLSDRVDELLGHANGRTAEHFEKNLKAIITQIKDQHKPDSDVEELERQRRNSNVSTWVDRQSGMHKTLIELDPLRHDEWNRAYNAHLTRLKHEAGSKDKTFQQLKVEAFLATVKAGGKAPTARVPKVIVLIDWETICNGRHPGTIAELADGTPIPIATIREMLCDAEVLPAVLGGSGEVLDLGRSRRLASRAQRDALLAMYATCMEPSCPTPAEQSDAHHMHPWDEHGPSDLANFALLCPSSHHKVHDQGWRIETDHRTITWYRPDGTVAHHGPAPNRRNQANSPPTRMGP